MENAVIIDCLRTAVGKSGRGTLKNTRPDDMAAAVFNDLLKRHLQIDGLKFGRETFETARLFRRIKT